MLTIEYTTEDGNAFTQGAWNDTRSGREMAEMNARLARILGWTCLVIPI